MVNPILIKTKSMDFFDTKNFGYHVNLLSVAASLKWILISYKARKMEKKNEKSSEIIFVLSTGFKYDLNELDLFATLRRLQY